jgi:hypothetical protein
MNNNDAIERTTIRHMPEIIDEKIRELVQIVDVLDFEFDEGTTAVTLLGRYISDAPTLSQFERDTINKVVNPLNDLSEHFIDWFARKMFERANEIGDSLED